MDFFQIEALLIVLAALFGTVNYKFLRLPSSIGILVVALASSLSILALDAAFPGSRMAETMRAAVLEVPFSETLLEGMLGLLLFAGALHVRIPDLRAQGRVILLMATVGVALSTLVAGLGFFWVAGVPILIALVFGALISPTDPVAVLGVLRAANLPKSIDTMIAGESLFNDGVGYVVFLLLVGLAFPATAAHDTSFLGTVGIFLYQTLGGVLIGAVLGWITYKLMAQVDDHALSVMLTLALASGGYAVSHALHVSAPIMAVVAGLMIGEALQDHVMSRETRAHVDTFWRLVDELLNAILFLMIGIEIFSVTFPEGSLEISLLTIPIVLLARLVAVSVPVLLLEPVRKFSRGVIPIMTWGGIKGGISVALVLSLPDHEWKPLLLTATYVVVVFSIVVQGLTIAPLAKILTRGTGAAPEDPGEDAHEADPAPTAPQEATGEKAP